MQPGQSVRNRFQRGDDMDMEKVIEVLISLLEEQEGVEIKYEIEKTAQAVNQMDKQQGGDNDASKKTAEIPDLERHLCSGRGNCRTGDGRIR